MADPAIKRTSATPCPFFAGGVVTVDDGLDRFLVFDAAVDSLFTLGRTNLLRHGRRSDHTIVCVIHRANGEVTHLYRVATISTRGRREVELLGVWTGARLREASERASTLSSTPGSVWEPQDAGFALDEAA